MHINANMLKLEGWAVEIMGMCKGFDGTCIYNSEAWLSPPVIVFTNNFRFINHSQELIDNIRDKY